MKVTKSLGMLLLAIWLILTGLIPLLQLSFSGLSTVMTILATALLFRVDGSNWGQTRFSEGLGAGE